MLLRTRSRRAVLQVVLLAGALPVGAGALHAQRSWLVLPHASYTPETRFAGGALVGYYRDGGLAARPSSVVSSATFTTRGQLMLELMPEFYLHGGELWLEAEGRVLRYPDVFYGIGNTTTPGMEENFTSRRVGLEVQVQRRITPGGWLGLRSQVQWEDIVDVDPEGLLAGGSITGSAGGATAGLGAAATLDTRDRAIAPGTGVLALARWTAFGSPLGSEYAFHHLQVDVRRYIALGDGVLAVRGRIEDVAGDAPFTMLPRLGGSRMLRGYREGRFRDQALLVTEVEYRVPLFWRLGGVVFAGAGDVAPNLGDLPSLSSFERAAGAGVRFRLNAAGVNVRVDFARGREEGGLYIGLGEAF